MIDMIDLMSVNFVAVVIAAVVAMVIGYAWYSMALFGKHWMKEVGLTEAKINEQKKNMGATYGLMLVSALIMAYVLGLVINLTGLAGPMGGMKVGFWLWLGFIATYALSLTLFEGRTFKWWSISAGYYLVTFVVMGLVIGMMA